MERYRRDSGLVFCVSYRRESFGADHNGQRQDCVVIPAPPLALSLPLQGGSGKSFIIVSLGLDLPARADASPLCHQEKAAK
jgi:hypothetical protein